MIRALTDDVPDDILAFFRSDGTKDADRFWALLSEWYRDSRSDQWLAHWEGFTFPEAKAPAFARAAFIGSAIFRGATFTADADLNGATFNGDADFSGAAFRGAALFEGATFTGDANFNGATFTGTAEFSLAAFAGQARFVSAFEGDAGFTEASFKEDADFSDLTFKRDVRFGGAHFTGTASFQSTSFAGHTYFNETTFAGHATFLGATFNDDVSFRIATFAKGLWFTDASFAGQALFIGARFTSGAYFPGVTFSGYTDFSGATFSGYVDFSGATIDQMVHLASLQFADPVALHFPRCSLAKVELRSLDASVIRLAYADEIERLVLRDVRWPEEANRTRTADEADLDSHALRPEQKPSPEEVERVYRGLRKNHEDRGNRVGAHGWYFSEMEVGRIHAKLFSKRTALKRMSRGFYKATSNYGLSAIRPAIWLAITVVLAVALFSLGTGWCPARLAANPAAEVCVGPQDRLQVALLAIFLQAPPTGIVLSGVLGQIVWLILRITGAAMLLSIGIAFRNQVAR